VIFNRTLTQTEVTRYYRPDSSLSVQFVSPSDITGNFSKNYIIANFTTVNSANNFTNLTVNLYNSTSLINSTVYLTNKSSYYLSYNNLSFGFYKINATLSDDVDVLNFTETRTYNLSGVCNPNWINYNTTCGYHCGSWNKFQTYYLDSFLCGTNSSLPVDNGTCYDCDYCIPTFDCILYNATCNGNPPTNYNCLSANDTTSCCSTTLLSSDCNFTGNISIFDRLYQIEMFSNVSVMVNSYPYVDFNVSYPIVLLVPTNNQSNVSMYLNGTYFNVPYVNGFYQITLLFTAIGDYPFVINATNPCSSIIGDIHGTFKVRHPFYITINGYKDFLNNSYVNNFAYLTAEFSNSYYNENLDMFIHPVNGRPVPVFHAYYIDGTGTLKLYEPNNYVIRLIDGQITFQSTYSPANVSKSYGTNVLVGKYYFNGSDETINVYFSSKDLHPYSWLFNWIFIIIIFGTVIVSIIVFFLFPDKPQISLGFFFILIVGSIIGRIAIWFFIGS